MNAQSDALYKEQYDLFMKTSGDYGKTVFDFIVKDILPSLPKSDSFLDVGAGQGTFTLMLADCFQHIGVVEPNTLYCNQIVKELLYRNKVVTACNGDWGSIQLGAQKFDLILCAHVLYHVHQVDWPLFINKMTDSLSSGGKAVIILLDKKSDNGQKLSNVFFNKNDKKYYAEDLTLCLSNMGQAYEKNSLSYHLPMQTRDDFLEMISFMLSGGPEIKSSIELEIIREKFYLVEPYYKTESGMFQFYETSQAIIIKK